MIDSVPGVFYVLLRFDLGSKEFHQALDQATSSLADLLRFRRHGILLRMYTSLQLLPDYVLLDKLKVQTGLAAEYTKIYARCTLRRGSR